MEEQVQSDLIGWISIALSIIALVNEEQRLFALAISIGSIAFLVISRLAERIEDYNQKIQKLEKELDLHKEIIDIKAKLISLSKEVSNDNRTKR